MTTPVRAVFDGQVFRPDEPVPLEPNARYVLTVEPEGAPAGAAGPAGQEVYPLSALGALATDMGVTDLAARHDWYARPGAVGAAGEDGAAVECALVWLRDLGAACRDRLQTEALPDASG